MEKLTYLITVSVKRNSYKLDRIPKSFKNDPIQVKNIKNTNLNMQHDLNYEKRLEEIVSSYFYNYVHKKYDINVRIQKSV